MAAYSGPITRVPQGKSGAQVSVWPRPGKRKANGPERLAHQLSDTHEGSILSLSESHRFQCRICADPSDIFHTQSNKLPAHAERAIGGLDLDCPRAL